MPSALFEAVLRCQGRRLAGAAAAGPVPAVVVVLLTLLAPFAFARAGRALGAELSGALDSPGIADAIVLGPTLVGAVAGAVLAASLPDRSAFGGQVAAAPFGDLVGVLARLVAPALLAAVALLPSLVVGCVVVGGELAGGRASGAALAAAVVAAVLCGALVAEAVLAAIRAPGLLGSGRWASLLLGLGGAWWLVGLALGTAPLGPLAFVPAALRDEASPWSALAVSCATALGAAGAWIGLAAERPSPRGSGSRRGRRLVRRPRGAVVAAAAALHGRRRDVRIGVVTALVFGSAGIALAAAAAAPAPAAFLLGTTTALLGSILCPLVTGGVLLEGRWLWRSTPRASAAIVCASALASMAGTGAPVATVAVVASAVSFPSAQSVAVVGALVVVASALALLAGSLVPWRSAGVGDQLTTLAAFAVAAVGASLAVGTVAPRLVAHGLPGAVVVVLVCVGSAWLGGHALGRRIRSAP